MKSHALRNMTAGSISGHLLAFAVPLFLGNLLQQLYNMVDSWVVGRYVSEAALAAVGIGFPINNMFISLFMGLSSGTTVVIAQYYGAGRLDRVRDVVDTVYTFFTAAVLPITALALLIAKPLLVLMRVQADAMGDAYLYLLILSAGLIGTIGYNINAGILQGVGNTRASLLFLGISAVMNIVLDLVFVINFHWGVAGVAIATIISQFCSWVFGIFYINRVYKEFTVRPFSFRFDRLLFRQIMRIGLPAGLQFASVSIGIMAVMSQINVFGTSFTAGYNVGHKLDSIAFLPIQSIAAAVTAFVGQNVGAREHRRVKRGMALALAYAIGWCVLILLILYPTRFAAASFFTDSQGAIQGAGLMMQCLLPFYAIFAVQFVICSVMRGAGESVVPMAIVIFSQVVFRVPAVYILAHYFGPERMYYAFGAGWTCGAVIALIYFASGRWKRHRSLADEDGAAQEARAAAGEELPLPEEAPAREALIQEIPAQEEIPARIPEIQPLSAQQAPVRIPEIRPLRPLRPAEEEDGEDRP